MLFDSEIFSQRIGGVSRQHVELIKKLRGEGVQTTLIVPISFNIHLRQSGMSAGLGVSLPDMLYNRWTNKLARISQRLSDELCSRLMSFDLLHQTYYNRIYPKHLRRVIVIADMIPELFPELFPKGNPHGRKADAAKDAELIICVSHHTKKDMERLMPDLTAKVEVVHHGVELSFYKKNASMVQNEGDYLLFVGGRKSYKNFSTFALAGAKILQEQSDLRVIVVGGETLSPEELAPFVERGVHRRVSHCTPSDEQLPAIYARAKAFVFPSRYEGFGLPILEAFASNCPVVLANASCFPEVADQAACYFDPESHESLLEALRRVTGDRKYRDQLRSEGLKRVELFTWEKAARKTAAAYRRVLGEGG